MLTILIIGVAAFAATLTGGLVALRLKDKLHLVTGFSAGAIIGVALFDLLPEAVALDGSPAPLMIGIGFSAYFIMDRMTSFHSHGENKNGLLGAGSLSFHSFLDGVIIGLAFQISSSIGLVVTAAVLTHDFSDGINTVAVVLRSGGREQALRWLFTDAIAPILGIITTFLWAIPKNALSPVLGIFCGFFLYIGASDLLPESRHSHPKKLTILMTVLGMATLYCVVRIAQ